MCSTCTLICTFFCTLLLPVFCLPKSLCRRKLHQSNLLYYMISVVHGSLHTKELYRSLMKEVVGSAVSVWGKPQKPSQTHLGRGAADTQPPPNNTGGVSPSVVYPHKPHQGQQLFVWANPNYSLDHHEKASALTSNTKSLKYKGFHFFLCFRCQHSRRSGGPRRKRRKDNGI